MITCINCNIILECVVKVSDHLKSGYIQTRFSSEGGEWPPDQPKHFTSLTLIHHKDGRTQQEAITIAEVIQSGDIDAMTSSTCEQNSFKGSNMFFSQSKTSKDIKEIFAADEKGKEPHSILIEGSPGIGKTVLSKEISFQWANSLLLVKEILVFLIFLKDPLVQQIRSLKDLVKYYYQFDESSENVASSCAEYLLNSDGKHVTFILDGYDEYPENLRQNGFISDIVWCKRMSKRSLMLTSRPHVSAHLHQWFDRRVDILGFTKEDRQNYITSSLEQRTEDIAPLIKYFDSHLTLSSLCFIPFNMTMLLWLYKQGVVLPNSSTELYNYFICHTIRHHLAKHGMFINDNILDLNKFEQPYKSVIQQLSVLSFKALNKNQLTFSLDEVKAVCPEIDKIPGAINCFGLLQAVQYPGIMKMTTMLNFVHFSLQEYLAAYYVTCLPYDDELSVLKEKFMSDIHSNMFAVYVGMTKGKRPAFKNYLRYDSSEGSFPSDKYITGPAFKRQCIESGSSGGSSLEGSDISISTEILKNENMCLRLFKCFHEAGDKDLCSQFIKAGCFSGSLGEGEVKYESSLSPCDAECLGLVLTNEKEWKKLHVPLSDAAIETLHHSLTTNTPTIHSIGLSGGYSSNKSTSYFIANIALMCETTYLIVRYITTEFMSLRNQLTLLMVVVKVQDPTTLANFLHENDVLKVLGLYTFRPEDLCEQSLHTIANSLKHNSTLQQLWISCDLLPEEQCCMISQRIDVVKWKVKGKKNLQIEYTSVLIFKIFNWLLDIMLPQSADVKSDTFWFSTQHYIRCYCNGLYLVYLQDLKQK